MSHLLHSRSRAASQHLQPNHTTTIVPGSSISSPSCLQPQSWDLLTSAHARDVQPGVPSLRMYPPPPWYWPRGETREPDLLRRRPDELCFSALGTDVMPRIMLFSTNRHIPLKIMYVLITVQVKSAPLAAAARHQFHRVSPVGGGEGEF